MHTRILAARYLATTFCYVAVNAVSQFCGDDSAVAEENALMGIAILNVDLIADTLKYAVKTAAQCFLSKPKSLIETADELLLIPSQQLRNEKLSRYDADTQTILLQIMPFRMLDIRAQARDLLAVKGNDQKIYAAKIQLCLTDAEREDRTIMVDFLEKPTLREKYAFYQTIDHPYQRDLCEQLLSPADRQILEFLKQPTPRARLDYFLQLESEQRRACVNEIDADEKQTLFMMSALDSDNQDLVTKLWSIIANKPALLGALSHQEQAKLDAYVSGTPVPTASESNGLREPTVRSRAHASSSAS